MAKKSKAHAEDLGKPFKKEVLCGISADQKATKQDRITAALGEIKTTKGEMKEATAGHRKTIRELENEVENLRAQVTSGKEMRMVSVSEHKDFRNDVVNIVRVDTREIVESRKMTVDERQETFPEVPRGAARKKGKAPALKALPAPAEAVAEARAEGEA